MNRAVPLLIFILMAMQFALSQENSMLSGTVRYKKIIGILPINNEDDEKKKLQQQTQGRLANIMANNSEYDLVFDEKFAHYTWNKNQKEPISNKIKLKSVRSSTFYYSKDSLDSRKKAEIGGVYKVYKSKFDRYNWQLTDETKTIAGYECKIAIGFELDTGPFGESKLEIPLVACYSTKILSPFGPDGYGGLPGLILELQRGSGVRFVAKEIIKAPNEVKIPKEYHKAITYKEYRDLLIAKANSILNNN